MVCWYRHDGGRHRREAGARPGGNGADADGHGQQDAALRHRDGLQQGRPLYRQHLRGVLHKNYQTLERPLVPNPKVSPDEYNELVIINFFLCFYNF